MNTRETPHRWGESAFPARSLELARKRAGEPQATPASCRKDFQP
jgi:hypothetical protein